MYREEIFFFSIFLDAFNSIVMKMEETKCSTTTYKMRKRSMNDEWNAQNILVNYM